MSFHEKVNEEASKQGSGGDWFKFKEGDNLMRILVEPEPFYEKYKVGVVYKDCGYSGTPKYLTWIQDKTDGKVKLFKMSFTIAKDLAAMQKDDESGFADFPMPYDIKVMVKNAGKKEVEYTVLPRKESEVDVEVLTELQRQNTPLEIINKMKEKQKEKVDKGEIVIEKAEIFSEETTAVNLDDDIGF